MRELFKEGLKKVQPSSKREGFATVPGVSWSDIQANLGSFQNAPHRLEHVARIQGIEFINDSKATNVNSTWYALESVGNDVIFSKTWSK